MKSVRACPICPECGSKKFIRIKGEQPVRVRCRSCKQIIEI